MATPPPAAAGSTGARVYLGRLPRDVRKEDIEDLFKGYGKMWDVKLMGTFGFCEFADAMDAEDVVKKFDGADLLGEKIIVEIAKGATRPPRDPYGAAERPRQARIRRGDYRIIISNLPPRTSWQDLKDIGREAGQISFADVDPHRPDEGILEYSNREDMDRALKKIEGLELRGNKLQADPAPPGPPPPMSGPPPPRGGGYGPRGGYDDYPPYGPPPGARGGYGPPPPRGYEYDYAYDRGYGPPPPMPRGGGYDRGGYGREYYGGGGGGRGGYERGYDRGDRRAPPPRDDDRYARRGDDDRGGRGGREESHSARPRDGGERSPSPPRRAEVD